MRDTFVRTLIEVAKKDKNIELVTGDLGFGVLKPYFETLPNQFTNAGIAEQNMTSVAAGMASMGKIVFTYSIGNFPTLRCLEQVRNDCTYHNENVKIVCVGGGLVYGSLGMSHHATEDIAIMRALPRITIICPGDPTEAEEATKAITYLPGTVYLRLGRGGERKVYDRIDNFQIGRAIKIKENQSYKKSVAIFSTGAILEETCKAVDMIINEGIGVEQYSFHTVKPIDEQTIIDVCSRQKTIITIEEGNIVGGFGSAVSEIITKYGLGAMVVRIGLEDYCTKVGCQQYLREQLGIDANGICKRVLSVVE